MRSAVISLALLSAVSASPLDFGLFRRSGDATAAPEASGHKGVQIVSKRDGLCLQPEVGAEKGDSDDKKYGDRRRSGSGDDKDSTGAEIAEGTKVVTVDCKDAKYLFDVPGKKGGEIALSGYDLVIDAGRKPADGGHLSLYKSNGTPQQQWVINEAQQIVLRDGKQAIDDGDKGLQTYTPAKGNVNQQFEIRKVEDGAAECPESTKPETVYKTEYKTVAKPTTETRYQTKYETKYETKVDTKTLPAATVTAPAQTITKTDTKQVQITQPAVTKTETKRVEVTQPAATITAPAQTVYKTETKTVTDTDTKKVVVTQPAATVTAPAQTVYKTETKTVQKPTTVYKTKVQTETVKASGKPVTLTVIQSKTEADKGQETKKDGAEHPAQTKPAEYPQPGEEKKDEQY